MFAASKRTGANSGQCFWQCEDGGGGGASKETECVVADACYSVRECKGGEPITKIKRFIVHPRQSVRQCNGGERTTLECFETDCLYPLRHHNTYIMIFSAARTDNTAVPDFQSIPDFDFIQFRGF